MSCYFAKIYFAESIESIQLKFNFMKNPKIFLWYIKKFNPYIVEDIYIGNRLGYKIILPLTEKLAIENQDIANNLLLRVIEELEFNNVNIISYPQEIILTQKLEVDIANGTDMMLLYIMEIIHKSLKALNKTLQKSEILLIVGEDYKSSSIIESIYREINYFNIIDENMVNKNYESDLEKIFLETGLNINVFAKNNGVLKNADIVINLKENNYELENRVKSGGILIDFGKKISKKKRLDILYISGITLKYKESFIKCDDMDLMLYANNVNYRKFKNYEYDYKYCLNTKNDLLNDGAKLSSLMCEDKILNSVNYLAISRNNNIK